MKRDTQENKPRFDLLFPKGIPYNEQILTRFAQLMTRGLEKYGERNWELANSKEELDRFRGSALRHCLQWFLDETDEDHGSATLFNIMAAETLKYKRKEIGGISNDTGKEGRNTNGWQEDYDKRAREESYSGYEEEYDSYCCEDEPCSCNY